MLTVGETEVYKEFSKTVLIFFKTTKNTEASLKISTDYDFYVNNSTELLVIE